MSFKAFWFPVTISRIVRLSLPILFKKGACQSNKGVLEATRTWHHQIGWIYIGIKTIPEIFPHNDQWQCVSLRRISSFLLDLREIWVFLERSIDLPYAWYQSEDWKRIIQYNIKMLSTLWITHSAFGSLAIVQRYSLPGPVWLLPERYIVPVDQEGRDCRTHTSNLDQLQES